MTASFAAPPADRIARRIAAAPNPALERAEITRLYNLLAPTHQDAALDLAAGFPRRIHSLAREGALAAPSPGSNLTHRRFP